MLLYSKNAGEQSMEPEGPPETLRELLRRTNLSERCEVVAATANVFGRVLSQNDPSVDVDLFGLEGIKSEKDRFVDARRSL